MLQKWLCRVAGLILTVLLLGGCLMGVGAMLGIGAYQWMEGTMTKDYPRKMEPTYQAVLAACKTMNLTIKKQFSGHEMLAGIETKNIAAVTASGTNVDIKLIPRPNNITSVQVRFGLMGNKDQSAYFHRLIMKNLGIE
jgi:hypothetical protein|uniref:DUF3568 family protein n=1 Tax=Desulfobacca acetoxidans TaxID=60893 RepID=A0A7V6DQR9_9BACT